MSLLRSLVEEADAMPEDPKEEDKKPMPIGLGGHRDAGQEDMREDIRPIRNRGQPAFPNRVIGFAKEVAAFIDTSPRTIDKLLIAIKSSDAIASNGAILRRVDDSVYFSPLMLRAVQKVMSANITLVDKSITVLLKEWEKRELAGLEYRDEYKNANGNAVVSIHPATDTTTRRRVEVMNARSEFAKTVALQIRIALGVTSGDYRYRPKRREFRNFLMIEQAMRAAGQSQLDAL
jgi:hypothetical protein